MSHSMAHGKPNRAIPNPAPCVSPSSISPIAAFHSVCHVPWALPVPVAFAFETQVATNSSNLAPDKINGAPQAHQSKRSVFETRWGGWGFGGLGRRVGAHTRYRIGALGCASTKKHKTNQRHMAHSMAHGKPNRAIHNPAPCVSPHPLPQPPTSPPTPSYFKNTPF